jgi:hypothetical protein
MPRELTATLAGFVAARKQIEAAPRLRGLGPSEAEQEAARQSIRDEIASLRQQTVATLKTQRADIEQLVTRLDRSLSSALGREQKSVAEATLQELREQRSWARLKPLLEATAGRAPESGASRIGASQDRWWNVSSEIANATRDALSANDEDTLQALRTELPAWLTTTFSRDLAERGLSSFHALMAEARPEVAAILTAQAEVNAGVKRLYLSIGSAETALTQGTPVVKVAGWTKDEAQEIALEEAGTSSAPVGAWMAPRVFTKE